MNQKWIVLLVVLALSACQGKKPEVVVGVPAPASSSEVVVATPAPTIEPVAIAAPVVTVPVVQEVVIDKPKPVVESAPLVASAPVVVPKVTAKPPVAAPKPVVAPIPVVTTPKPVVVAAPVVAAAVTNDADAVAVAKKRNCFACHMVDKKIVGPAWKDVAAKYRGDAGAQARLEAKISKGGSGVWGAMAMPPQPAVTPGERALLAKFILGLK